MLGNANTTNGFVVSYLVESMAAVAGEGNRVMSERNHPAMNLKNRPQKSTSLWLITGSLAVLLAGGLGFQVWRAQAGSAAEEPGKVTVSKGQTAVAPVKREAAAKVTKGGRAISIPLDDVAKECLARVGNDVLDSMINRAVIQLACEEVGITITEAEVEQEIIRISKQFNIPTETWLQMLQTERNVSPEQYKRDVIWPMLALKKLAGDKVAVTEDDMHKAFSRQFGPRVKCRMIMVDNIRRANEIWQKANLHKDDFPRLAREHSIDPNSRAMEGLVPPIARYAGNPELEDAAFKLKEGDISGIVSVGFNRYVILKCEGFTEQKVQDPTEVKDMLYKDLVEEKVQESVAKLFEGLKKSSRIDNYWNNTTTGDVKQVSGAQPAPQGPKTGSGVQPATGLKPGANLVPQSAMKGGSASTSRSANSNPAPATGATKRQ